MVWFCTEYRGCCGCYRQRSSIKNHLREARPCVFRRLLPLPCIFCLSLLVFFTLLLQCVSAVDERSPNICGTIEGEFIFLMPSIYCPSLRTFIILLILKLCNYGLLEQLHVYAYYTNILNFFFFILADLKTYDQPLYVGQNEEPIRILASERPEHQLLSEVTSFLISPFHC